MGNPVHLFLLIFAFITVPLVHGTVLHNENNPSLLDRVLQVVWEPSSLIRMWVGLDQLYNIALSWRTAAKKLASLPFSEGRSMDHVKIQEPRHFKYHKPSVASQWDRFNEIYASSNLSPIVSDTRNRLTFAHQQPNNFLGSHLEAAENYAHNSYQRHPKSVVFGLPPHFFYQTDEQFLNHNTLNFLKSGSELPYLLPFKNDPMLIQKLLVLQKLENERILQDKFLNKLDGVGAASPVQQKVDLPDSFLNGGPQERLNMFLKLLKNLGDMHENDIRRESLEKSNV